MEYDVVVIGGGSGSQVAVAAAERGLEAAAIERGPLGGACVTRGCVPSKALLHRAQLLAEIRDAGRFGVDATVDGIDYDRITDEVEERVFEKARRQARSLRETDGVALYDGEARFVDDRTLAVDGTERVRGDRVVLAVGARPSIPPIDGLEAVDFLTSAEALWLDEPPDELAVVGGGYVGVEMGTLFAEVGTDVTVVGRSDRLLPGQDEAASEAITRALDRRADVRTGTEATAVSAADGRVTVTVEAVDGDGNGAETGTHEVTADELLVAAGRRPNTDTLDLGETGIETDDEGHVVVDDGLATTADYAWALGDCVGAYPFKHAADYEARVVSANVLADAGAGSGTAEASGRGDGGGTGVERTVDYAGLAHAVFSIPQVASVGKTEADLAEAGIDYESTTAEYAAAPMGMVLDPEEGFVKLLAEPGGGEILGCHVVGPDASTLIHEVAVAMRSGSGTVDDVATAIHVHPALNEVLQRAFVDLSTAPYATAPDWRETADE